MDLQPEELQFLSLTDIIKESTAIPKLSPITFYLITLTLIFPLSFAILAHSLFTHPVLSRLQDPDLPLNSQSHQWVLLLLFQFIYLIFLFVFSLLSTAAVVFTVASTVVGGGSTTVDWNLGAMSTSTSTAPLATGLKTYFKTPEGRYKLHYEKTHPSSLLHYTH